ncbi:MAG: thiamine pyrophosphate-dependent dehydrogenase E1 component subunit alpha [Nanoarchaeota archaeon]|nr:thiamine pyrophosphate-dependent dehydrogenase E1 component subunit alpha [Nanoarchaeota archaeon]
MPTSLEFYKKLYLIRAVEEGIRKYYSENEMKTPMHMSMGSEALVVGVVSALKKSDQVFGTYRSHALYLAKTGETNAFFAEMYGKRTGGAKGKAGSMHLSAPEEGFLGTSAVVGTTIPVAVGAAFANKKKKNGKMVAVFFGEGAMDEGVFWESINLASLWNLPIVFICEDNNLAIHTPVLKRQGYASIEAIVSRFNMNVIQSESTDVERVFALARKARLTTEQTQRPSFMRLAYYRYLEHVGVNEDFEAGYRAKSEFDAWYKKDPVRVQKKRLLKKGVRASAIGQIEKRLDAKIEESIAHAKQAPFAEEGEAYTDVFA